MIRLRYEDHAIELVALDNGNGVVESELKHPSSGFGLVGLRERIELLGGNVAYGPEQSSQGYRVTIYLPMVSQAIA